MGKSKKSNKKTDDVENEEGQTGVDSDLSLCTADSFGSPPVEGRFWRAKKRPRIRSGSGTSSDNEQDIDAASKPRTLIGLNREARAKKREEALLEAERQIDEQARAADESRQALGLQKTDVGDVRTAAALNKQVLDDVAIILNVASKSKNLKGTFVRALKEAAASVKSAVEVLHSRTSSEEVKKLQAENAQLRSEIEELRKEMAQIREEMTQSKRRSSTPVTREQRPRREGTTAGVSTDVDMTNPVEELTGAILRQVGTMVNARFEALEERLLPEKRVRPPLAADRSEVRAPRPLSQPVSQPSQQETLTSAATQNRLSQRSNTGKSKAKKKGKGRKVTTIVDSTPQAQSLSVQQARRPTEEGWTEVTRKKSKEKKAVAEREKTGKQSIKLRPPKSTAVVITLHPEAEAKGLTYASILAEAKSKIDLSSCGITDLRFKKAATGARVLEVPGRSSGDKADSLASKLKEVLGDKVARISRPTKCAELRVIGLDDSATTEEVIAAVVEQGCCSADTVKAGDIRRLAQGQGVIWVRCPVAAAKKLSDAGRLQIGWVSAQVKLLPSREMRCYRCLHSGHVRAQCKSEIDRTEECYRCGLRGHKASNCSATPKCSLCAAANRPFDHFLGGKHCSPPKANKYSGKPGNLRVAATQSGPTTMSGEEEEMIAE